MRYWSGFHTRAPRRCGVRQIYEVGASNLGHIVLYTVLNETEGVLCDRSYMPGDDMQVLRPPPTLTSCTSLRAI